MLVDLALSSGKGRGTEDRNLRMCVQAIGFADCTLRECARADDGVVGRRICGEVRAKPCQNGVFGFRGVM